MQKNDNFTNTSQKESYQCDDPNDTNNETNGSTWETCLSKKQKRKNRKIKSFVLQRVNDTCTNAKENISNNKSSTLHFANDKNVNNDSKLSQTVDISNTNTVKHNNTRDKNDKNTSSSISNSPQIYNAKDKKGKRTFLEKDNTQANINTSMDETLLPANKENNNDDSILSKTVDLSNTDIVEYNAHHNGHRRDRKIKKLNRSRFANLNLKLRKKDAPTNIQVNDSNDKANTLQFINNEDCNNLPSISTVESKRSKNTNNKNTSNTSTLIQDLFIPFYNIDYEFHEANHAIIDTFALNIYFHLCADDRKTFCLICDETFQIQNNDNLRQHLYKHIRSDKHVELLSQMIEEDKKCLKNGKLYSKLGLARESMKSKNDFVECLLCDSKNFPNKIENNERLLQEHITSSKHQNFKVSWTSSVKNVLQEVHNIFQSLFNDAKKYRCELCNYESSSEIYFIKHLRVPYHMTRLVEIRGHVEKFKFYYCSKCLLVWFGSSEMYNRHGEQMEHILKKTFNSHLFSHLPEQVIQFLIALKENAEVLFERSSNCIHNNEPINYILCNLITDLRRFWPNIQAYPFGSRISDLGFANSDIDIFLDCDNMYEGRNSTHRHCQTLIAMVANYLSFNKQSWKVLEVILHSRTPIAKVQHILSGLICDISVKNGLAVENTKIIKCFNNAFPLCRKMILFLKRWLHFCGLLGSHLVTSYALTWCVIFYLQTLLVFPSISELIKLKHKSWRISGWEVGISYNFPIRKIDHTFEELLLGFFIFYADFNYKNHIVCPLLGKSIEKNAFAELSKLPQEMIPYINYMHNTSTEEKPQAFSISPLCVQDPFDLSHNLTKAVYNRKLKRFQTCCTFSATVLKKIFPYLKPPL